MTTYEKLSNPPVTEALINIQYVLNNNCNIEDLKSIKNKISDVYKLEQEIRIEETRIEKKNNEQKITTFSKLEGYRYISENKTELVQFRGNGFTFNKLKPYRSWEEIRNEAQRVWILLNELTTPLLIRRVGLRYINNLNAPMLIGEDFKEYLTNPPEVPKGLPQKLNSFLSRIVVPDHENNFLAIITQSLERIIDLNKPIPIILDIDVFKSKDDGFKEEEIWQELEKLRNFKNDIFFKSITNKLRGIYK